MICTVLKHKKIKAKGVKIISKPTSIHDNMEKLLMVCVVDKEAAHRRYHDGTIICKKA